MQKESTGGWAEEPEGHAPSAPRSAGPAQSRCKLQAERAEHRERAAWGGSRGGLARAAPSLPLPSALGPRGPRRSGKMALHFQVSAPGCGPGAPAGGGGSRPRPRAQPLAWEPWGRRAQRSRLRSAALVGAATAASRQVGAGAEGPPSASQAQPTVVARPRSLSSEAGTAGARQRGQRTVIGRRRAGGSGRGATGSAQPHWWSLGAGRGLRWRDAGLPGGSRTLQVLVLLTPLEPPHGVVSAVAERPRDAGRRQLPPLSF